LDLKKHLFNSNQRVKESMLKSQASLVENRFNFELYEPKRQISVTTLTVDHESDYNKEEVRYKTFESYPNKDISIELLARTGFYYKGNADETICNFCKNTFKNWKCNKDVVKLHYKCARNCPLMTRKRTANIPIDTTKLDLILPPLIYDECGSGYHFTQSRTGYKRNEYPRFTKYEIRLKTFENWPKSMKQRPEEMAEAGLFYTSEGDKVLCYDCGIGLKDWESDDNPWIEHAKWTKNCYFLEFMKGTDFILTSKSDNPSNLEFDAAAFSSTRSDQINNNDEGIHINETCTICLNGAAEVALLPCGHASYCTKCSINIYDCTICKTPVESKMRFFYT